MIARLGTMIPFNSLYSESKSSYFDRAKVFIDWLHSTNQQCWQVLPLHPTSYKKKLKIFHSPYSSYGVGLNPQFLSAKEREMQVDTGRFVNEHEEWIHDYALFVALSRNQGTDRWGLWSPKYRNAGLPEVSSFYETHSAEIGAIIREQAVLHHLYNDLLEYAGYRNIQMWGDIPFYLELHTPLAWKYQNAFSIDTDGSMEYVAGSRGGKHFGNRQVWGFPLYRYDTPESLDAMKLLWDIRIRYAAKLYHRVRLDAAVRFFSYEKLHVTDPDKDTKSKTPNPQLFSHVVNYSRELGMDVYIEDISGLDMTLMHKHADALDVAGISVASMLLAKKKVQVSRRDFDSAKYKKNHIFFTSTHDTLPLLPYLESLTRKQQKKIERLFRLEKKMRRISRKSTSLVLAGEVREILIRRCSTLIVPMQDWLLSRERINVPGVISINNWNYKMGVPLEHLRQHTMKKPLVCFDLDGVIVFRSTTFGEYYIRKHKGSAGAMKIFFRDIYQKCLTGKMDLQTELKKNIAAFGWHGTPGGLMKQWFAIECESINKPLLATVRALRDLGVKSVICSDQEKYRSMHLSSLVGRNFNGEYFSWEVGYLKHKRKFWDTLLSRTKKMPEQILFVDDDMRNIRTAEKAGITCVLYAGGESLEYRMMKALYSPENGSPARPAIF